MTDAARQEILSRIRTALAVEAHHQTERVDEGRAPQPGNLQPPASVTPTKPDSPRDELVKQFAAELTQAGGLFYYAEDAPSACEHLRKIVASASARRVIGWRWPVFQRIGLPELFAKAGVEFAEDGAPGQSGDFTAAAIEADIGVTGAHFALAETGTLVMLSGTGLARTASLMPPIHVAIVESEQVIPTLDDLLSRINTGGSPAGLSSAITLVTGPSRTADIELVLVVGVHGPQQLHVILLDGK